MSRTYEALQKAEAERSRAVDVERERATTPGVDPERIDHVDQRNPAHLEYEKIRVWLRSSAGSGQRLQTVMVVACHSGSGSTTTASLLAATLAESRRSRVLVIDSNFRTPGLNMVFRIAPNGHAAGNGEEPSFDSRLQATDRENLYVLTNPDRAASPLDQFDDDALDELLTEAKRRFDVVIFDAAPVLDFPDAYALAPKVDGIILVTESEGTLIEDAQRAKRDLERAGGRLLGVVLNRQTNHLPAVLRRFFGAN